MFTYCYFEAYDQSEDHVGNWSIFINHETLDKT